MSNDLIISEGMSDEALNQMLGISTSGGNSRVELKINKHSEDDQERQIPMGSFYISGGETSEPAYSKSIEFRIISPTYQYERYDSKEEKYLARSIIANNFKAEFISDDGTIRCGKLTKKQAEGQILSEEQKVLQEQVDCKMTLWGLVTFTGKSADGTVVEYKDYPVAWRLSQTGFMEAMTILKAYEKSKKAAVKYPLTVTLRKEKKGDTIYYVPVFVIAAEPSPIPNKVSDALQSMKEYITSINNMVTDSYNAAIAKRSSVSAEEEEIVARVAGVVADYAIENEPAPPKRETSKRDGLNDDLPF